jgi:hypothetical protein
VAAILLLALAPVPVVVGRLVLSDRGATPITAAIVAIGVAATIMCLLGSVTAARLTLRPAQRRKPAQQRKPARHTSKAGRH